MNRTAKTLLVLALVGVVAMAFRVSWNALRDVARAIGADETAANLYPFVVDGLMALALIATLVLTDRDDRRFALRVLATYTIASLILNYVHGLVPALHGRSVDWGRLADWDPANWALVLLATSLPVGSIYFGSDLVAKVLHHRPDTEPVVPVVTPLPASDPVQHPIEGAPTAAPEVSTAAPARPERPSASEDVSALVICGDRRVWPLAVPASDTGEEVTGEPGERLPTEAAANVIRACWVMGTPVTETARQATRSTSYVKKVFARLEDERGPQPSPGQLSLVPSEVSA
ncbi:DUF2637 domain-containing protein [Streptomyces sp. NRRL F-5135]|uniref:DUF2637 domain-containing protein n=1 Tax=Streptomyces sp. NRRL F-5135 TaxID=1463858 RepID=UPI000AF880C3|nr:DUF2637 domain-containing protein [Streptomyces sp. NRRL F-5135]